MSKKRPRRLLTGFALACLLLITGCAKVAPPQTYDVSKPAKGPAPRLATDLVIVLDTRLDWTSRPLVHDQFEYPPFTEYLAFAEALEAEFKSRWPDIQFNVAHSTRPEPDLKVHIGRGHIVIMNLHSLVFSSQSGVKDRTWQLTVLQGVAPENRIYSPLMQARFSSDFPNCYSKQVVVSDNKPQCRKDIVAHMVSLLTQAEVLR